MLDAFEARLADLLADRLAAPEAGVAGLAVPERGAAGSLPATGVVPHVRLLSVVADPLLGDDAPRLRPDPGGPRLRTVLALRGEAAVELVAAADASAALRLRALDAVLVALQEEALRRGTGFDDGTDQGFALRGFRFLRAGPAEGETGLAEATLRAVYAFEGEFWPVRPEAEGPAIVTIPRRLVTLPVEAPETLSARAGGPDLAIPLRLDLNATGGAPARVVARLRGAAPPGTLLGEALPAAPGSVAVAVTDGAARLSYRPPATLEGPARARIAAALEAEGRETVPLAELVVEVLP